MIIILILILIVMFLLPTYIEPRVIHNFISEDERKHIMEKARENLKASEVDVDRHVDKNIRVSETAWLTKSDPIVKNVIERCVALTDRPIENCEDLQVVKYKTGGFYKPHQDAFNDTDKKKRMYTIILALNDEYEGGETKFPNLNKSYKLKTGDALFFNTLDNYEFLTKKALHGGNPVNKGEKWICNVWVRKYP